MFDLAILFFAFGLGAYHISLELHRRFLGTWVERIFPVDGNGEVYRLFCLTVGCKLSLAAILATFYIFFVVT